MNLHKNLIRLNTLLLIQDQRGQSKLLNSTQQSHPGSTVTKEVQARCIGNLPCNRGQISQEKVAGKIAKINKGGHPFDLLLYIAAHPGNVCPASFALDNLRLTICFATMSASWRCNSSEMAHETLRKILFSKDTGIDSSQTYTQRPPWKSLAGYPQVPPTVSLSASSKWTI